MEEDRYIRQSTLAQIGPQGQQLIGQARVAVIGLGALGSAAAELLARAGVGFLRLVDRDQISLSNLQRCLMYTQKDAEQSVYKATAAKRCITEINPEITVEALVVDIDASNIESLIADVDYVLDGTDNFKIRYLINEACHKHRKTWIYTGVLASYGVTMVIPPQGPCFKCLCPTPPGSGKNLTCVDVGILSSITVTMASLEVAAVLKLIVGNPVEPGRYLTVDVWEATCDEQQILQTPTCPCCVEEAYEYLPH